MLASMNESVFREPRKIIALFVFAVGVCFSVMSTHTRASSIHSFNYVRFYGSTDPRAFYACANSDGTICSGAVDVPGTNWSAEYFAKSLSDFGVMKAASSVSLSGDNSSGAFESFLSVGGSAGFRDTLLFESDVLSGNATALFTFSVTGSSSQTTGQSGRPQFNYVPTVNGQLDPSNTRSFLVQNGEVVIDVPFVFGIPIDFQIDFYALSQIFTWTDGAAASADYFNTAILNQITVIDSSGLLQDAFSIESESGTRYTSAGVVPEPASLALLGLGLAGIGYQRRKRAA